MPYASKDLQEELYYGDMVKLVLNPMHTLWGSLDESFWAPEPAIGFYREVNDERIVLAPTQVDAYVCRHENDSEEAVEDTYSSYALDDITSFEVREEYWPRCDNPFDQRIMDMTPAEPTPTSIKIRDITCVCGNCE